MLFMNKVKIRHLIHLKVIPITNRRAKNIGVDRTSSNGNNIKSHDQLTTFISFSPIMVNWTKNNSHILSPE